MSLSRARDRLRKRLQRGTILPSPTTDLLMMGPEKRKERLVELITMPIQPDKVRAEHIIASIKELNLMEHVYDTNVNINNDNRTLNIIVKSEDGKHALEQLHSGKLPKVV